MQASFLPRQEPMGRPGELSHADEKKFKQLQNSTERELLTVTLAGAIWESWEM